jgi:hypothetical protein
VTEGFEPEDDDKAFQARRALAREGRPLLAALSLLGRSMHRAGLLTDTDRDELIHYLQAAHRRRSGEGD